MSEQLPKAPIATTVAMTTAVQSFTSFALSIASVLAPVAAPDLGMPATRVGILVAIFFLTGIVAGLVCGPLITRYGPIGTLRMAILLAAIALAAAGGTHVALAVIYAVLAGFAHGVINPAASQVLAQAAPPRLRSLIFSIKQTGVPIGMAFAGALLPPFLLLVSWQLALFLIAGAGSAMLLVLRPFYAVYDRNRRPEVPFALADIAGPIAATLSEPRLRQLSIAAAMFAFVQPCVTTYLVSYLNLELGYSLIAAGLIFSVASVASVFGRILWGAIADWTGRPRRVLAGLALLMGACSLVAAGFSPSWPPAAVVVVVVLWGASAIGWNGVFLAEVARLAPEGKVSLVTSGSQVYMFAGAVVGPPLFGAIAAASGGFGFAFLLLSALPLALGVALLRSSLAAAKAAASS